MPFSMVPAPPQAPKVDPPRPLSLVSLNFASGGNYALSIVGPPTPPPGPRWPRFGYLAEGDYAQCLGPLCQRGTMVMLVATLLRAAFAMVK